MMTYAVTVKRSDSTDERGYQKWETVYDQQVNMLDLWAVIEAVNKCQNEANAPEVNP